MVQITGLSKMRIIRQIAEQNLKEGPESCESSFIPLKCSFAVIIYLCRTKTFPLRGGKSRKFI